MSAAKKLIYKCIGCGVPTSELHEIIPGHGRRKICIEYGLQVPVCRGCHDTCHGKKTGKLNRINRGMSSVSVEDVETRLCAIVSLDYVSTRRAVWTSDLATLREIEMKMRPWLKSQEVWYNAD